MAKKRHQSTIHLNLRLLITVIGFLVLAFGIAVLINQVGADISSTGSVISHNVDVKLTNSKDGKPLTNVTVKLTNCEVISGSNAQAASIRADAGFCQTLHLLDSKPDSTGLIRLFGQHTINLASDSRETLDGRLFFSVLARLEIVGDGIVPEISGATSGRFLTSITITHPLNTNLRLLVSPSTLNIRQEISTPSSSTPTPTATTATPSSTPTTPAETGAGGPAGGGNTPGATATPTAPGTTGPAGSTTAPATPTGTPLAIPTAIIPAKPDKAIDDIPTLIKNIFEFAINAAGVIFIILFFVGSIMYMLSGGDEAQTTKAKKLLIDATVGLVLVAAAFAISTFIAKQFGIGG